MRWVFVPFYPKYVESLYFSAQTLLGGGAHGQCGFDGHEVLSTDTRCCHFGLKSVTMKVSNNKTILYPQVAGTIVTYELILLQFNRDEKVLGCNEG